jgi:antirestriction protein
MTEKTQEQRIKDPRYEEAVDQLGDAFDAFLEAETYARGRDVMDEDLDVVKLVVEFSDHYRGKWESKEEFTRHALIDQGIGWNGADPATLDDLRGYLDWERISREFFQGYTMVDGHVFENEV